jgi:hypothetical protein
VEQPDNLDALYKIDRKRQHYFEDEFKKIKNNENNSYPDNNIKILAFDEALRIANKKEEKRLLNLYSNKEDKKNTEKGEGCSKNNGKNDDTDFV